MSDFEVHIGLPRPIDAPDIAGIPPAWKRDPVLGLVALKGRHEFQEHNVEGRLMTLLTRHAGSIHDVQELVNEAAGFCRHDHSSRIEVEQILASCGADLSLDEVTEFAFSPTRSAFPNLKLIPETPPYEVHYCLSWSKPDSAISLQQARAICADAAIGIDELVEFGGDAKITTTKFYKKLQDLLGELRTDAQKFIAALHRSGTEPRFRLIAERIITCGIPI